MIYITDKDFKEPESSNQLEKSKSPPTPRCLSVSSSSNSLDLCPPPPVPFFSQNKLILKSGRPKIREIVEEQIESTDYSDYLAIGACGPGAMTSDLADVVSSAIHTDKVLKGEKRRNIVSYYSFYFVLRFITDPSFSFTPAITRRRIWLVE